VPGLHRRSPKRLVLELTRALAEDYETVPLAEVSRVVQQAVDTAVGPDGEWAGTPAGVTALVAVIEHLAREDLDQARADRPTSAKVPPAPKVRPAPTARGQRAARRSEPRRDAG
jgi:hypothetical protein